MQAVVDGHFANAFRGSCENDVSYFQGHEFRHVTDNLVNGEQHVSAIAVLHAVVVQHQLEIQIFEVSKMLFFHKFADDSGAVEGFGNLPRVAFGYAFPLQVSGGKVNTQADSIVVSMSEFWLDALSHFADAEKEFHLVMNLLRKIRQEEGTVADDDG